VTVQPRCDYRCTFCIVPMTGGRASRKLEACARGDGPRARRHHRSHLLPDGHSYDDGAHHFADLRAAVARSRACGGCGSQSPYPRNFTDRVRRPWRRPRGARRAPAGAERLVARAQADVRRYDRARYLEVVPRCATRFRLPSPPTSSWIPASRRGLSETLSLVSRWVDRRVHLQYSPAQDLHPDRPRMPFTDTVRVSG